MEGSSIKERPILFSGPMVNAILDGRKAQTRRIVKLPEGVAMTAEEILKVIHNPYGQIGDRLWVRETWADVNTESGPAILYKALGGESTPRYHFCSEDAFPVEYDRYPTCKFTMWCGDLLRDEPGHSWRPSIFMPRNLSRITLEITNVRVERLQDITAEDCLAEGLAREEREHFAYPFHGVAGLMQSHEWRISPIDAFQFLWDKINGKRASWESNPWVWLIEFKVIQ